MDYWILTFDNKISLICQIDSDFFYRDDTEMMYKVKRLGSQLEKLSLWFCEHANDMSRTSVRIIRHVDYTTNNPCLSCDDKRREHVAASHLYGIRLIKARAKIKLVASHFIVGRLQLLANDFVFVLPRHQLALRSLLVVTQLRDLLLTFHCPTLGVFESLR